MLSHDQVVVPFETSEDGARLLWRDFAGRCHEHQTRDTLRLRVDETRRDGATEAVADKDEALQAKRVGDGRDVLREQVDPVVLIPWRGGLAVAAQVERDRAARCSEMRQLRRPMRRTARKRVHEDHRRAPGAAVIDVERS